MADKLKKARWASCNVLQVGVDSRHLWAFTAGKNGFAFNQEQTVPAGSPLPPKLVARNWTMLFQPRLNLALLPIDKVFLRVVHLPAGNLDETLAMVELQLEKLSPLPITQIVWSVQPLPHTVDNLQTMIVIIVARDLVDQFIGQLEGQGYMADRLEVPMIDQLLATPITSDGAWVYPGTDTGKFTALVAWWYGGALRSLGLLHLPAAPNRGELLEEQLKQMTWAGELEGWLTSPPRWHLVADETTAKIWQPMFFSWLGNSVDVESPISPPDLAALTANRAARAEARTNILPPEYSERYRQQFVDRLWMGGVAAVLGVYIVGVLIFFAARSVQSYRTEDVEAQARGLSNTYTNVLKDEAMLKILQERQTLKFAFLDAWKTIAEQLPEGLTLQSLDFHAGRTVSLRGIAPADQGKLITDFNERLRKVPATNGQPMFEQVLPSRSSLGPGGTTLNWDFSCDLAGGNDQE